MSEGRTSEGSASEGSKNPELRVPLRCEWTTSDGSECAACFSDVSTFASHVRDHYRRLFGSMKLACCWNGCDFMSKEGSALIQHILFHPFHSYLKLLGAEIQTKFQLPSCQIDEQYKNLVPSLQVALRCQWDGGKCVSEFDSVGDFFFHARKHVMMQDNRCCQCKWKGCSFVGRNRSKLMEHCRTHTGEKVAACPRCGSLFASNTKFKDHLIRQGNHENSQFSCSICFHSYPSERLLREHIRRHINTLKCPHCDLTCNGPSRLQHHIHFRHSNETPQQCPICQKEFKTGHCLSDHLETHGHKSFHCSISGCKYVGKTLKAWQSHMKKAHMPERKEYCCHICGACFLEGIQLSTHLKTIHGFSLPPGHSRFRYITGSDGFKRLQTLRLDSDNIVIE